MRNLFNVLTSLTIRLYLTFPNFTQPQKAMASNKKSTLAIGKMGQVHRREIDEDEVLSIVRNLNLEVR